jgi:hypothetical protein
MKKRFFFLVILTIILLILFLVQNGGFSGGLGFAMALLAPIELTILIIWCLIIIFSKKRTSIFFYSLVVISFVFLILNINIFFKLNKYKMMSAEKTMSSPYWTNVSVKDTADWKTFKGGDNFLSINLKYPKEWKYGIEYEYEDENISFRDPRDVFEDHGSGADEFDYPCVEIDEINQRRLGYSTSEDNIKKYKLDNGIEIFKTALTSHDSGCEEQKAFIITKNIKYVARWATCDPKSFCYKEDFDRMLLSVEPAD